MKTICVYLGANFGGRKIFEQETLKLAHEIADMGLTLVYGGSSLGMMGLLATTVKKLGGRVIGVITTHLLEEEKPLENLDELHVVNSMQDRKKMLQNLAETFVVMPGGLGTLEEALETWNAIKIGELDKKIGFLNVSNYFDKLFYFIGNCQENGFLSEKQSLIPVISGDPIFLLHELMKPKKNITNEEKINVISALD